MTAERDPLDRFVLASVFLHAGLITLVVLSPRFLPSFGPNWGSNTGSADAGIKVKIAGSSSAIPLPTPEVVTEDAPANDNPGFYKNEEPPAPPPPPTKNAEPIPETTPIKPPPAPKPTQKTTRPSGNHGQPRISTQTKREARAKTRAAPAAIIRNGLSGISPSCWRRRVITPYPLASRGRLSQFEFKRFAQHRRCRTKPEQTWRCPGLRP